MTDYLLRFQPKEDNAADSVRSSVASAPSPLPVSSAISSLCRPVSPGVFKMTQRKMDFGKLDELRQKDEKLFEMSLDLLFSIGFNNFKEEILNDALEEMNEGFGLNKASIKEMELLVVKMLVLSLVSEIHAVPLETVLDYITENGWRSHEKSGC